MIGLPCGEETMTTC